MRRKLLVTLAVLIAIGVGWYLLWPTPQDRLDDLIAELRADGEPVTLAEMEPPMPADADNGAADIDAAIAWFAALELDGDWGAGIGRPEGRHGGLARRGWNEPAEKADAESLAEFIDGLAPMFDLLDRGAQKAEIAWALPQYPASRPPEFQCLYLHSQLLSARAIGARTPDERLEAVATHLSIAVRLRCRTNGERVSRSMLHTDAITSLQHLVQSGAVDPSAARDRLASVLAHPWMSEFADAVRTERIELIEQVREEVSGVPRVAPSATIYADWTPGWRRFVPDALRGGDAYTPTGRIRIARDAERCIDLAHDLRAVRRLPGRMPEFPGRFAGTYANSLMKAAVASRIARLALAALEHRRAVGAWPDSTDALSEQFPGGVLIDPYNEQPLWMETDGEELEIRAFPWWGADDWRPSVYIWRLAPQ